GGDGLAQFLPAPVAIQRSSVSRNATSRALSLAGAPVSESSGIFLPSFVPSRPESLSRRKLCPTSPGVTRSEPLRAALGRPTRLAYACAGRRSSSTPSARFSPWQLSADAHE